MRYIALIWMLWAIRSHGDIGKQGETYGSDAVHFKPVTEDKAGLGIIHPAGS